MRWLAIVLFACSCGSPRTPTLPVAPMASSRPSTLPPELAVPLPPADPLVRGKDVERTIKGGDAHRLRIQLQAGQVALGVVMQALKRMLRYAWCVAERDRQAFLNAATGTFTETSHEWVLSADQWSQAYYQYRDGKLYFVENDNKEQQYSERELDIPAFIRRHAATPTSPHPEMVAFLVERDGAMD